MAELAYKYISQSFCVGNETTAYWQNVIASKLNLKIFKIHHLDLFPYPFHIIAFYLTKRGLSFAGLINRRHVLSQSKLAQV